MSERIFTIGHSDRSLAQLITLLKDTRIATLVDVRAVPQSQRHPQFSQDSLRAGAEAAALVYHWAGRQLGGRRESHPGSPHVALAEPGLRAFADYMDTEPFRRGIAQLRGLARSAPTAILCAERLPDNCHRSLIADYLTLAGVSVLHLIAPGETREHQLRAEVRRESAQLIYDRNATGALF